jgi:acetolactate synthase I/II/III large subunit
MTADVTGGALLAGLLHEYGVEYVVGMPGETGAFLAPMYERAERGPRHIVVRDERNASYAAIGYARLSGRVMGLDAGGPGVSSVMMTAGIVEARNMSIPVLALVTEVSQQAGARRLFGAHSQSMDQVAMLRPLLKYDSVVSDVALLPELLRQALQHATTGRPGPVALFLPSDVLEADAAHVDGGFVDKRLARLGSFRSAPERTALEQAAQLLLGAKRPIILSGGGAVLSGAADAIVRLAEQLLIPVATTLTGSGVIDENHRLSVGVPGGLWGIDCALEALAEADLVFLIGTKCSYSSTAGRYPQAGQQAIQLDVDPTEPGKMFPEAVRLVGDAKLGVEELSGLIGPAERGNGEQWLRKIDWLKETWRNWFLTEAARRGVTVSCKAVMKELEGRLGSNDILVCDASSSAGWGAYARIKKGADRIAIRGIATLGSSLGAAIGAKLARPNATVVQLTGDGGHGYHIGELATVSKLGMKLVTVVLNNRSLGSIQVYPGFPRESTMIGDIDFAKAAEACGWKGISVTSPDTLGAALDIAFESGGPVLLDVEVDPLETPNPVNRIEPIAEARREKIAAAETASIGGSLA